MKEPWSIKSRARECAESGDAFQSGQKIRAAIFPDPESSGYLRKDYTIEAWENRKGEEDPFSCWLTTYEPPVTEEKAEDVVDDDSIEEGTDGAIIHSPTRKSRLPSKKAKETKKDYVSSKKEKTVSKKESKKEYKEEMKEEKKEKKKEREMKKADQGVSAEEEAILARRAARKKRIDSIHSDIPIDDFSEDAQKTLIHARAARKEVLAQIEKES